MWLNEVESVLLASAMHARDLSLCAEVASGRYFPASDPPSLPSCAHAKKRSVQCSAVPAAMEKGAGQGRAREVLGSCAPSPSRIGEVSAGVSAAANETREPPPAAAVGVTHWFRVGTQRTQRNTTVQHTRIENE